MAKEGRSSTCPSAVQGTEHRALRDCVHFKPGSEVQPLSVTMGRISGPSVAAHPKFQQQPPAISDGDNDDSIHHILVSGQSYVAQIPLPPFYR